MQRIGSKFVAGLVGIAVTMLCSSAVKAVSPLDLDKTYNRTARDMALSTRLLQSSTGPKPGRRYKFTGNVRLIYTPRVRYFGIKDQAGHPQPDRFIPPFGEATIVVSSASADDHLKGVLHVTSRLLNPDGDEPTCVEAMKKLAMALEGKRDESVEWAHVRWTVHHSKNGVSISIYDL